MKRVSIPFDQGDVFRLNTTDSDWGKQQSQSLSIRAMSFDSMLLVIIFGSICLNPFRAGRCLSTNTT